MKSFKLKFEATSWSLFPEQQKYLKLSLHRQKYLDLIPIYIDVKKWMSGITASLNNQPVQ